MGLVALWHVESSRIRAQTHVPCTGRQIVKHCTTREVPILLFFFKAVCVYIFIYLLTYLLTYLFLAVLGLHFCVRAFSSCGERGPLFIAVCGPLTIEASLVAEHRLQTRRLSSCGSWALSLRCMWDLPRPGLEPVSPALAGRLSTTEPPGKPPILLFKTWIFKKLTTESMYFNTHNTNIMLRMQRIKVVKFSTK